MKKSILTVLALTLIFSLAACGGSTGTPGGESTRPGSQGANPSGDETPTSVSSSSQSGAKTVDGWNDNFAGTILPGPETNGTITEWTVKSDSVTIRIDGMSYEEYIAYCKKLEALNGWKVYEGDYPENVAHFPANYNDRSKVYFTGSYGKLPHITVQYYSDKTCAGNGYPHFCMFVYYEWN